MDRDNSTAQTLAQRLESAFPKEGTIAVALSGGVDSSVVAQAAFLAGGSRAVALTADSPSVARRDLQDARAVATKIGIQHVIVLTKEFDNPAYAKNDSQRCYHCKSELYDGIIRWANQQKTTIYLCSGANKDDLGDYRPGLVAAAERLVHHPLVDVNFGKAEVRLLAEFWGLPVADKPASPCLASRLAPGLAVTDERTRRVESAEAFLQDRGFREFRVRYHEGELARIEVAPEELPLFTAGPMRVEIIDFFRSIGFRYVTIDLQGFRSGSLNSMIPLEIRQKNQQIISELHDTEGTV